ncbi:hypothetical protein CAAN1_01S07118 [[Candida] anglica]|uniref:RNA polymerase II subunit B1 CTD phosphatase RPAP2 homolog n=1 Tax=[Candida] anglica TaxID=148631 RepID=A0ABP0EL44_9ASCO
MILLTIDALLSLLAPHANKENLSPTDASNVQLLITELLTDHHVDLPLLKFLSRFLTPQAYDEIVEERNIEHLCGYIVCDSSPRQPARRFSAGTHTSVTVPGGSSDGSGASSGSTFQIYNRKPSIILPNTYRSQYCCKEHYQASLFYSNQLSHEAVFARKHILSARPFPDNYPATWYENGITCLEEVLAKHRELRDQGKSLGDIISMMNGLSVVDTAASTGETRDLVQLLQDFDIVEKEGGIQGEEEDSEEQPESAQESARGIDGYVTTDRCYGGYVV